MESARIIAPKGDGPPFALKLIMSSPTPPPLPKRAIKTDAPSMSRMDKAFALATPAPSFARESEPRNVSFASWDDKSVRTDVGAAEMRRAHLQKYVKATMGGSMLILLVGLLRVAISGGHEEEEIARATFAKMRDVPADIADLPRQISTLTARTQASLKIERRHETMKTKIASSRSNAFW
jgi:hypothetical protein